MAYILVYGKCNINQLTAEMVKLAVVDLWCGLMDTVEVCAGFQCCSAALFCFGNFIANS